MGNDCRSYVSMNLNRIRLKVSFQHCSCCGSTSSKQRRLNQTRVNKRRGRQFWKIFKGYVLSGNGTWEMRKEESRKTTETMYFTGSLEISVIIILNAFNIQYKLLSSYYLSNLYFLIASCTLTSKYSSDLTNSHKICLLCICLDEDRVPSPDLDHCSISRTQSGT